MTGPVSLADHAGVRLTHGKPRVNGVEIHYAIGGTGEPVFLLHGVPKTMSYWRHVVPLLTPHYTVVAVDNRGFGGSGRPAVGYDTATMARDVAALATHLGFDQFRVAGEDWGAAITYAAAAFHRSAGAAAGVPGDAAARTASGRARPVPSARRWPHRLALQLLQRAQPPRTPPGRARTAVLDLLRQTPDVGSQRPDRGVTSMRWCARSSSRAVPGQSWRCIAPVRSMPSRTGRTTVIRSAARSSPSAPRLTSRKQVYTQLAQVASNVRGAVIAESGHNIALENPAALAGAYLDFFARI